jgi:hypothetical protein
MDEFQKVMLFKFQKRKSEKEKIGKKTRKIQRRSPYPSRPNRALL